MAPGRAAGVLAGADQAAARAGALARAEVFKKNLQKRPDYNPPMSEQKENLRKAEASLQDAEKRLAAVKKWQPLFKQAVLEYHASVQRIKDLAAGDIPRAVNLLSRMIDSLEAYLRVAPPSGLEILRATGGGGRGHDGHPVCRRSTRSRSKALDEAEAAARARQRQSESRSRGPSEAAAQST